MFEEVARGRKYMLILLIASGLFLTLMILTRQRSDVDQAKSNLEFESGPIKMIAGGLGAVQEKDDEVIDVVNKIKPILEERTGIKYESIDVLAYKTQIVAGKNYFVKAEVKPADGGEPSITHLRIYKDLKKNVELTAFEENKSREEDLRHFQ